MQELGRTRVAFDGFVAFEHQFVIDLVKLPHKKQRSRIRTRINRPGNPLTLPRKSK